MMKKLRIRAFRSILVEYPKVYFSFILVCSISQIRPDTQIIPRMEITKNLVGIAMIRGLKNHEMLFNLLIVPFILDIPLEKCKNDEH